MMNMTTKRPAQGEATEDLISKLKRAKISGNVIEIKRDDDDGFMFFGNHSRLVMATSPTSVGDQEVDCGSSINPEPLTFSSDVPSSSRILQSRPHLISPYESMTCFHDESNELKPLQSYSLPGHLDAPNLLKNVSDVLKPAPPTKVTVNSPVAPKVANSGSQHVKAKKPTAVSFASFVIGLMVLCLAFLGTSRLLAPRIHAGTNTVYVPGAGFSGFWFTLGRLRSIPEPATKDFYCFSAGCLGVVATFSNFTIGEVSDMAIGVQAKWRTGEISQYQVVSKFLDVLLQRFQDDATAQDGVDNDSLKLLSRLHIITSVQGKYFGLHHVIRTPKNVVELREMLLQTTWIPIALGDDMTHKGHLDGAFTTFHHPTCEQSLDLPLIADLYFNALNVNLSKQKLEKLWNAGLQYS